MNITSKSKEETQEIAEKFAKDLKGGEVLCFYGNLGTGKTTFIQGLAKGLEIKQNITSPTFVLMKKYRSKKQEARIKNLNFYHLDCYRLGSVEEAQDLGIEEIWDDKKNVIAIEWADKINDILPKERVDICFEHVDENKRKITIFKG